MDKLPDVDDMLCLQIVNVCGWHAGFMLCQRRPQNGWMLMMILGLMQSRLATGILSIAHF